jgi:hypothetical protein
LWSNRREIEMPMRTPPLTEGKVRKGGHNDGLSQITERPAPPSPITRRATQNLRDRCVDFVHRVNYNATFNQPDPVEDLVAFVTTEIARAADSRLEDSTPLALFFHSKEDRDEFVAAIIEAKPGMISKRWPR